jgi:hypothetical protein
MEYITKEAAQKCLDDLSSDNLIGNENDTFISVAEAKDRIEELPTADVAPKSEIAREIFAKLRKDFYEECTKLNNELSKAIRENNPIEENALLALASGVRAARRIIANCEAKYMAGGNKSEILYGGPREGGRKYAEKEMEEWKKRGEQ